MNKNKNSSSNIPKIFEKLTMNNTMQDYYKNSHLKDEKWFKEWFELVFAWHFETYSDDYTIDNCEGYLETILHLSENIWDDTDVYDQCDQWKECLDSDDEPDHYDTAPVYFCKKHQSIKERLFKNKEFDDFMKEKFWNFHVDLHNSQNKILGINE